MKINEIRTRDQLPIFLNDYLPDNAIGIEIGVEVGIYASCLLKDCNKLKKLYLVDAWQSFNQNEYLDMLNTDNDEQLSRMLETAKRLNELGFQKRYGLIKDLSAEASKLFPTGFFDFIYIDANHGYKGCLEDLQLWFPKLKKRGVIAGHDYVNTDTGDVLFEVKKAVDEFFGEENIYHTPDDWPSWIFKKNIYARNK